jgi:hypothetical protein
MDAGSPCDPLGSEGAGEPDGEALLWHCTDGRAMANVQGDFGAQGFDAFGRYFTSAALTFAGVHVFVHASDRQCSRQPFLELAILGWQKAASGTE